MRDPFHDLHHHETGSTSHIRLISEGGSSHARTPELVCIDSIQATLTCTTESQHTVYPATAQSAAPLEAPLCSLPAEHSSTLDREGLPRLLRQRLQLLGILLGPGTRVTVQEPGRLWLIEDAGRCYSVRRLAARIAVYLDAP